MIKKPNETFHLVSFCPSTPCSLEPTYRSLHYPYNTTHFSVLGLKDDFLNIPGYLLPGPFCLHKDGSWHSTNLDCSHTRVQIQLLPFCPGTHYRLAFLPLVALCLLLYIDDLFLYSLPDSQSDTTSWLNFFRFRGDQLLPFKAQLSSPKSPIQNSFSHPNP